MKILRFESLNSTNTWALEHFEELEDFTAICADIQTQGRGRFNRIWVSEEGGNIFLSIVLKPQKTDFVPNLTQYLSVVTARIVESYGVKPQIKWPNDVLVDGKKVSGILCEASMKHNKIRGVVLGIGVNLNMSEDAIKSLGRPATSLNLLTGKKIDKFDFLNLLSSEFKKDYQRVVENGFEVFKEEYLKRTDFLGKTIFLQQRDGAQKEECTAKFFDDMGNLVVATKDGAEKTVFSGDLIL